MEIEHDDVACLAPRRKKAMVINKVLFNLGKSLSLMLFASRVSIC